MNVLTKNFCYYQTFFPSNEPIGNSSLPSSGSLFVSNLQSHEVNSVATKKTEASSFHGQDGDLIDEELLLGLRPLDIRMDLSSTAAWSM